MSRGSVSPAEDTFCVQGWQHFATTPAPQPPAPGEPARSVEERLAYHSAFVTVQTPAIDTLTTSVRTLMLLGRHQQATARPSLIVTGPGAAGKTTALLHVGRACHLAHTAQHPPATPMMQCPSWLWSDGQSPPSASSARCVRHPVGFFEASGESDLLTRGFFPSSSSQASVRKVQDS